MSNHQIHSYIPRAILRVLLRGVNITFKQITTFSDRFAWPLLLGVVRKEFLGFATA